jgi:hypothetical protein
MNELELKFLTQEGENILLREENAKLRESLEWFANEQDFWRSKFLKEHPECDNWEYVENARENEDS